MSNSSDKCPVISPTCHSPVAWTVRGQCLSVLLLISSTRAGNPRPMTFLPKLTFITFPLLFAFLCDLFDLSHSARPYVWMIIKAKIHFSSQVRALARILLDEIRALCDGEKLLIRGSTSRRWKRIFSNISPSSG